MAGTNPQAGFHDMSPDKTSNVQQSSSERALIESALRDALDAVRSSSPRTSDSSGRPQPSFSQPAADSFPGYEIVREIHRGGQGVVYQAIQKATKRKVAIKVMRDGALASPRERARFEREVQILGQLDHPNIARIHDSGNAGEWSFHVMDYISGQPLDVYMASGQRTLDQTLRLFQKIADAVSAAHLRGVIHRDLKPGNIRIDPAGEPHILDFGLAKMGSSQVFDESRPQLMTITGQFVGSLPWASPEQAEGSPDKIDIRTDVYSLGVVLYQMLTSHFPYEVVGNMRDVLNTILTCEPAKPSSISRQINDEVETIVLKCLSKERERRYQSAGELARDIGHYIAGEPIEAKRDSGWYVLRKSLRRYRAGAAVAAGFMVLVMASAVALSILYRDAQHNAAIARQAQVKAEHEATLARANAGILSGIVEFVDPAGLGGKDFAYLDAAAARVGTDFADQPEQEAKLRRALAIGYWAAQTDNLARGLDGAEAQAAAALAIYERIFSRDHPESLACRVFLAGVSKNRGLFDQAKRQAQEVVDIVRASGISPHPFEPHAYCALSVAHAAAREFNLAADDLREALRLAHRAFGPFDSRTHNLKTFLLFVLCSDMKCDQAEALALSWYNEAQAQPPENLEARGRSIDLLCFVYQNCGKPAEAARYQAIGKQILEQTAAAKVKK